MEDSMPASWAFLFWLLDALVEDFISPEAPHREETQISERSCPFGRDPAFEKINLAGSAKQRRASNQGS